MAEPNIRCIRARKMGSRWFVACPGCGVTAEIDDDQAAGRVSIVCPNECGFHETINLNELADTNTGIEHEVPF